MVGRHGISNEQIYKIAEFQGFKCALSKVPFEIIDGEIYDPTTKKRIAMNHDHTTGFIRGLLIQKVNWLIDQWEKSSYESYLCHPKLWLTNKTHPHSK